MKITLNGKEAETPHHNLKDLVSHLSTETKHIIAEINGEIIKAPAWPNTQIKDGDTIELITFMGGGSGDAGGEAFVRPQRSEDERSAAGGRTRADASEIETIHDTPLMISGKAFQSRFLLGTGKFKNKTDVRESILASRTEIVTVALRRIDIERHEENILEYIPENITLLTNTSGARTAQEAVRIARLAQEAGYGNWIKVEVINDSKYLLPDNNETIKATAMLAQEGFVVMPYMFPDLYAARELVKAGAATVMPLGSLIGSNRGLQAKDFIKILIDEVDIPIIVDAGIGAPSQAAEAMEMGADAVLVNTAVASAENAPLIAKAFAHAVEAGRRAHLSRLPEVKNSANASSPLTGFLYNS